MAKLARHLANFTVPLGLSTTLQRCVKVNPAELLKRNRMIQYGTERRREGSHGKSLLAGK